MNEVLQLAIKRICAYLVDYILIAILVGVLVGINIYVLGLELSPTENMRSKLTGHVIGFSTLTVPVWLYFTLMESTKQGATLGKKVMSLAVQRSKDSRQLTLTESALRSAAKLAPWEIAHIAIWYVPERPFVDPMPILNLTVSTLALITALFYVFSLFVNSGQTLYDKVSGSMVVKV